MTNERNLATAREYRAHARASRVGVYATLGALCATLLLLQAFGLWNDSYAYNEHGRLAAGLIKITRADFSPFRVNPPLPDMVGALPARLLGAESPKRSELNLAPFARTEYGAGSWFLEHNADHFLYLRLGRLCELLFSLVGALACFYYARWLFGDVSGLIACGLWCFSPYILGFGRLVCPDVPSAALGVAAVGVFHYWLSSRTQGALVASGLLLGLAELCKYTLIVFYPLFFILWLVYRSRDLLRNGIRAWLRECGALFFYVFTLSALVINMGYLFERTCAPLGEYRFQSKLFSGAETLGEVSGQGGNRFINTPLAKIPVPLPYNYVLGIDTQRIDFENGMPSYWRGDWRQHGWALYYANAALVKTPVGALALLALALGLTARRGAYRLARRDELVLWAPGLAIFFLVSSQTGFSIHSRYIIPALPTFFIATSRVGRLFSHTRPLPAPRRLRVARVFALLATLCLALEVLAVYPHEVSFFNRLTPLLNPSRPYARLPRNEERSPLLRAKNWLTAGSYAAPRQFLDSNLDWGVEEYRLAQWLRKRPDLDYLNVTLWSEGWREIHKEFAEHVSELGFAQPYWHAISVNCLYERDETHRYLWKKEPEAIIGYSIYVYRVDPKVDRPSY